MVSEDVNCRMDNVVLLPCDKIITLKCVSVCTSRDNVVNIDNINIVSNVKK